MRKVLFISILSVFLSQTTKADISLARQAYEYGDYQTAHREFSILATAGDGIASYYLAFMYYQGQGIEQNLEQAFQYFQQAALTGYPPAQDTLAYFYNHGLGTDKDSMRAYVWYSLASANGIFLAESIKHQLGNNLSQRQMVQADDMIREYKRLFERP